ncbi:hypothetical protein GPECTOR_52g37 [Gonium pectorale]|uniref:Apple domain-containing protein n=1 Tax=Gonium pectorale TaxID=33097 RepID=A0A150G6Z0_GONPE|nr:hypothetical protein GPECTOR_52g37 [Gonium pectorale]|eukprot:KXZ45636.1 hypothetical protein GPECTOR_52g37 [Gonium pectorale]
MGPVPRGYSSSPLMFEGSTLGSAVIACTNMRYVTDLYLSDDLGNSPFLIYMAIARCSDGTGGGAVANLEPGSATQVSVTCKAGFDAVKVYQSVPSVGFYPPMQVSFRCSSDGSWTTPVGTAAGTSNTTQVIVDCPIGALVSGFQVDYNASFVASFAIVCSPSDTVNRWWYEPLAVCPRPDGYDFLPGVLDDYLPVISTYSTLNSSGVSSAVSDCDSRQGSFDYWQTTVPGYGAGTSCRGTLVKAPPAPRQFYCVANISMTGPPALTLTVGSLADCYANCNNNSACQAFQYDVETSQCAIYSGTFVPGSNIPSGTTYAATCWVANAPWYCMPGGLTVKGQHNTSLGLSSDPLPRATPDECRAECDANKYCTHYMYTSLWESKFGCYLFKQPWYGQEYSNGALDQAGRVCLKTPNHRNLNGVAAVGSDTHRSLCFPGTHLGGRNAWLQYRDETYSTTSCAWRCSQHWGCSHWSLLLDGACYLYTGADLFTVSFGPVSDTLVSCLAAVTGSFVCLPRGASIRFDVLSNTVGLGGSSACATACRADWSCRGYYHTYDGDICTLYSAVLAEGAFGSNLPSGASADDEVCLRSLNYMQLFSDPPPNPPASPPPPSPNPPLAGIFPVAMAPVPIRYTPWLSSGSWTLQSCGASSYITSISMADGGGDYVTLIQAGACSDASTPTGYVAVKGPQPSVFGCADGFDAVKAEEAYNEPGAMPAAGAHPAVQVSFRCTKDDLFSSPAMGSGAGLDPTRTVTIVTCPADNTVITSLEIYSNSSAVGVIRIYCTPRDGRNPPSPLASCLASPGFYSLPGYFAPGVTLGRYTKSGLLTAFTACASDDDCTALTYNEVDRDPYLETQTSDQGALQLETPGDGGGECYGTFVRTPTGPRQYYCVVDLGLTGDSPQKAGTVNLIDCAYLCSSGSFGSCGAFTHTSSKNDCVVRATPFASNQSLSLSTLVPKVSCWAASDPWFCMPDGFELASYPAPYSTSYRRATPEQCRFDCDWDASCQHYSYNPETYECALRYVTFYGGQDSNQPTASGFRTCIKTPQHHTFSANGQPYGSLCFPGVSLGGSTPKYSAPSPNQPTSCASVCRTYGCGHWHLNTDGTCDVYEKGEALAPGGKGYGTTNTVALSCLAAVTGTYECLASGQGVAYDLLSTLEGVETRESCAESCNGDSACAGIIYDSKAATCVTFKNLFIGSKGANGNSGGPASDLFRLAKAFTAAFAAAFARPHLPNLAKSGTAIAGAARPPSTVTSPVAEPEAAVARATQPGPIIAFAA